MSVDGGTTWHDADTLAEAPSTYIGGGALYRLVVRNCGDTYLTGVLVDDLDLGISSYDVTDYLPVGGEVVLEQGDIEELYQPERCSESGGAQNVAYVRAFYFGTRVTDEDSAWVICYLEGCTPGYWKQGHHFDSWPAPYTPDTPFSNVFEDAFPGKSLLAVLKLNGGGLNALGRHTVAALLNAASPDVHSDLTPGEVIEIFNDVYPGTKQSYNSWKDYFEGFNEQWCPLN